MLIRVHFESPEPKETASAYARLLQAEQPRVHAPAMLRDGTLLAMRGGFFQPVLNWNPILPITSATVEPTASGIAVQLRAKLTGLVVVCSVLTALGGMYAISSRSPSAIAVVVAVVWFWIFGMNVLTAHANMRAKLLGIWEQITQRRDALSDSMQACARSLARHHGSRRPYSPEEVLASVERVGTRADFTDYALAMFLDEEAFIEVLLGRRTSLRDSADDGPAYRTNVLVQAEAPQTRLQLGERYADLRAELAMCGQLAGQGEAIPRNQV